MKRVVLAAGFITIALPGFAFADNGPGCGLGQMIFKGQSGFLPHTSAATTNGSTYNQLFGLTSGTLGCDGNAVVQNDFEKKVFVAANIDSLATDVARGEGEHLVSLATLIGVQEQDKSAFYQLAQANYAAMFDSTSSSTDGVLASLQVAMLDNEQLAKYVR